MYIRSEERGLFRIRSIVSTTFPLNKAGATMVKHAGFCGAVCGILQSAKQGLKENQSYLNLVRMSVTE